MDETTSTETLTKRVARAVHVTRWCGRESTASRDIATAALAVVADDVDGIAGVLRAHRDYYHADWGQLCACGYQPRSVLPNAELAKHQAAMVADYLRGA